MSCGNSHYPQLSLSWGLLLVIPSGGPFLGLRQVPHRPALISTHLKTQVSKHLSKFLEFFLCCSLLLGCAANSSHCGFTRGSALSHAT